MFLRVWWVSLIYSLAFWLYYACIIIAEETFLKGKFSKEYEKYLARTPVFIPNFKLWQRPILPFSMRNVLKREYPGFFGVIAAYAILEFAGDYIAEGRIVFDPVWVSIFTFGLLVYVILRTLKKRTRLLHVEGR